MCQNRIMFKQFIAEGAIDIVQIDSCRMGGLNEVLAVLLIAAKPQLCPELALQSYARAMNLTDLETLVLQGPGKV